MMTSSANCLYSVDQQIELFELCTAIFAGGCFWYVEADFEKVPGAVKAELC